MPHNSVTNFVRGCPDFVDEDAELRAIYQELKKKFELHREKRRAISTAAYHTLLVMNFFVGKVRFEWQSQKVSAQQMGAQRMEDNAMKWAAVHKYQSCSILYTILLHIFLVC